MSALFDGLKNYEIGNYTVFAVRGKTGSDNDEYHLSGLEREEDRFV
jgi:hypothetical protein